MTIDWDFWSVFTIGFTIYLIVMACYYNWRDFDE